MTLEKRVKELEKKIRQHRFTRGEHPLFCVCGLPIDAASHLLDLSGLCLPHVFREDPAFKGLCADCGHRVGHDVHLRENSVREHADDEEQVNGALARSAAKIGMMDLTMISDEAVREFRKAWMKNLRDLGHEVNESAFARRDIFNECDDERKRQDKKYGGPDHDDEHDALDWVDLVTAHARLAYTGHDVYTDMLRKQMVRVMALAVAAIEWCDRKTNAD